MANITQIAAWFALKFAATADRLCGATFAQTPARG